MNSLLELWQAATAPVNIAFTVMLGIVLIYWLIVLLGLIDSDSLDMDIDADMELPDFLKFLNFGEVPLMAVLSILLLSFWMLIMAGNHYLNPAGSWLIAIGLWVPAFFLSMLLTRWITAPMRRMFKEFARAEKAASVKLVGEVCEVTTTSVDEKFGQAIFQHNGAPLILHIRASASEDLKKGDLALIISEDPGSRIFKVVKYQKPEEN